MEGGSPSGLCNQSYPGQDGREQSVWKKQVQGDYVIGLTLVELGEVYPDEKSKTYVIT